jgi:hypothetical protein
MEEIKYPCLARLGRSWIVFFIFFVSQIVEAKFNFKPEPHFLKSSKPSEESSDSNLKPPFVSPGKPNWAVEVFSDKLIADFHRRYEELYGAFESFRLVRSYPVDQNMFVVDNLTLRDEMIRESEVMVRIGEYIVLKATEYQIDQYLRSDPKTKDIYKAKERFTNGNLKVVPQFNIKTKYSISGNYLEASSNFQDSFYSYRMVLSKWSDGFLKSSEQIFLWDYKLSKVSSMRALYYIEDTGYSVTLRRKMKEQVTTSITYNNDRRLPAEGVTEDSLMLGLAFYEAPNFLLRQ